MKFNFLTAKIYKKEAYSLFTSYDDIESLINAIDKISTLSKIEHQNTIIDFINHLSTRIDFQKELEDKDKKLLKYFVKFDFGLNYINKNNNIIIRDYCIKFMTIKKLKNF